MATVQSMKCVSASRHNFLFIFFLVYLIIIVTESTNKSAGKLLWLWTSLSSHSDWMYNVKVRDKMKWVFTNDDVTVSVNTVGVYMSVTCRLTIFRYMLWHFYFFIMLMWWFYVYWMPHCAIQFCFIFWPDVETTVRRMYKLQRVSDWKKGIYRGSLQARCTKTFQLDM